MTTMKTWKLGDVVRFYTDGKRIKAVMPQKQWVMTGEEYFSLLGTLWEAGYRWTTEWTEITPAPKEPTFDRATYEMVANELGYLVCVGSDRAGRPRYKVPKKYRQEVYKAMGLR